MKRQLFVLEPDGTVRSATSRQEFLEFMSDNSKKVLSCDDVYGICEVVTSFLGKEPAGKTKSRSKPQLFETMVLGGVIDGSSRLYETYDDALLGHDAIVKLVHMSIN